MHIASNVHPMLLAGYAVGAVNGINSLPKTLAVPIVLKDDWCFSHVCFLLDASASAADFYENERSLALSLANKVSSELSTLTVGKFNTKYEPIVEAVQPDKAGYDVLWTRLRGDVTAEGGTFMEAGLEGCFQHLKRIAKSGIARKTIVLLTDGAPDDEPWAKAKEILDAGIRIIVVGVGEAVEKLHADNLRRLVGNAATDLFIPTLSGKNFGDAVNQILLRDVSAAMCGECTATKQTNMCLAKHRPSQLQATVFMPSAACQLALRASLGSANCTALAQA